MPAEPAEVAGYLCDHLHSVEAGYLLFVLFNVGDKLVVAGGTIADKARIAGAKLHAAGGTLVLPPWLHPETFSIVRRHYR